MRISQKLEYACRAMAQLARQHGTHSVTRLEEIAQREAVSANFLVQILNDLRRGGLIESKRGKEGGYLLSRHPSQITLREIVEVIEPNALTFSVMVEGQSGSGVAKAWQALANDFHHKLSTITLDQMSTSPDNVMFYI